MVHKDCQERQNEDVGLKTNETEKFVGLTKKKFQISNMLVGSTKRECSSVGLERDIANVKAVGS